MDSAAPLDDLAAIIPAYNAGAHLAAVIDTVSRYVPRGRIVVVDDGSSDDTRAVAQRAGVVVEVHPQNRGKGAAIRSGIARAATLGVTYAILLDADGQHNPDQIPAFVARARETGADMVVGNRLVDTGNMPWLRLVTNHVTSAVVSALAGQKVPDSQNGYRLIRLALFARIPLTTSRYEIESEMIIRAGRAGGKIASVPVQTIYGAEKSFINPFIDTGRFLRMVVKSVFW
ncbi:MAG: glycosyltransferase family 2 protein [Candidatus Krumholzibacteria bacterium]|nr:glycosyltransferase family 2 protein [Candidatus Krumholzibacteria bacterium]MDH4337180.1 glycosyltransferase family 2 protein [Candidatus Krumholzibacteria bacterium]MDH5269102.1 glycosyltransferase family 2 protein [Candidatus Krumholzibacteria bacterium]MDH5628276.1 glycosyltransferase family 2 protein [Candidatus Krumholzibacteria bacterium]